MIYTRTPFVKPNVEDELFTKHAGLASIFSSTFVLAWHIFGFEFPFLASDARFNHWPIAASNLRGSWVVCQAKFSSRRSHAHFTHLHFPGYLNSAAKENRCVAVMFIEHDFGGFARIKRELDCFNEPERASRTAPNLRRYSCKGTGVTVNENLICRSMLSVAFCEAIRSPVINS